MIEACDDIPDDRHLKEDRLQGTDSMESPEDGSVATNAPSFIPRTAASECRIRVLVLYTSAAQNSESNIRNTIQSAVDDANQSFINSHINCRIELAYAGLTSYTEVSAIETNNNRFRNNNDGYIDEVHTLRNRYSADVCVLLATGTNACGIASAINAVADNSFCTVETSCAVSNHSFAHEIGHLLGCRHDTYVDTHSTPFAHGHGYVYSSGNWRTVMAYSNACPSCVRRQFWSNPNITLGGVPMGTVSTNNNVRVWNEQSDKIMGFRQPENNVVISSADILSSTGNADVEAKQTVTTSGNVNIASGKSGSMRAGSSITLKPGFTAAAGSVFSANTEDVSDCGAYPIHVGGWPNLACTGSSSQFNVTDADTYSVRIYSRWGSAVHSSSGSVTGNLVTVWNVPSSQTNGTYYIEITFRSQYYEESRAYAVLVLSCSKSNNEIENDDGTELSKNQSQGNTDINGLQEMLPDSQFDFNIYPNPSDGNFTLMLNTKEIQPFLVEIINSAGVLVAKKEYHAHQVDINQTGLPQGVYFVKLSMGGNVSVKRIVVNQ